MPRIPVRIDNSLPTQAITKAVPAAFARVQTGDYKAQTAQRSAESSSMAVRALPFGDGNLIAGTTFTSGTALAISHQLRRVPQGAFPVGIFNSAPVKWAIVSSDTYTIKLIVDATCRVDWWVF